MFSKVQELPLFRVCFQDHLCTLKVIEQIGTRVSLSPSYVTLDLHFTKFTAATVAATRNIAFIVNILNWNFNIHSFNNLILIL